MSAKPSFFVELKRRNVLRAGVLYAGAVWALAQGISQLTPAIGLPDVATRWFLIAAIIGFPFWIAFAWFYEWTPQGLKLESEVAADASITRSTGRRMDRAIIAVLAIAVVLLLTNTFVWHKGTGLESQSGGSAAVLAKIPAKSIAVLPFENLSNDKNNAYFVAGMQDLILTKLADIGDLKVISRTSTEKYASHPEDLRTVGEQLGVATILEGSVQKADNQVLINVQLIDARTDDHIWAQSYTRTLDNIFGVEGEVSQKVTEALNAKLSAVEQRALAARLTENPAAYDAYLRGLAFEKKASSGNDSLPLEVDALRQAQTLYAEAVEFDPKFAMAWARLGYIKVLIYYRFIDRSPAFLARAKQAIDKSLQLQPDLGPGYLVLAQYYYLGLRDLDAAVPPLQQARTLLPNDADVLVAMSDVEERQGKWPDANVHLRQAALLEPRSAGWLEDLADNYAGMREFPQARAMLDRALLLDPGDPKLIMDEASTWQEQGNLDAAQKLLDKVPLSIDPGDALFTRWQQFMDRRDYAGAVAAMQSFIANPDNGGLNRIAGRSFLARALDMAGRRNEARALATQVIAELESQRKSPADDVRLAVILSHTYPVLGDKTDALREAQRNVVVHSTCSVCEPYAISQLAQLRARFGDADAALAVIPYLLEVPNGMTVSDLRLDPGWDPLRHDPRFEALLKKYAAHPPATITSISAPDSSDIHGTGGSKHE